VQGEAAVVVGAGVLTGGEAALKVAKDASLEQDEAAGAVFLTDDDVFGHDENDE
jgi:hypothetical protein